FYQAGLILTAYSGYALGIYSYFYLSAPLWLIIPIMGFCSYLAFTPLHDSTHRAASSNKLVNDIMGSVSAFLLFPFMLAPVYRFLHMTHHRYVGDDDLDPDSILVSIPTRYYPFGFLILLVFDTVWLYWLFTKGWNRMPTQVRWMACTTVLAYLAFNIFWYTSPYWFEFFVLFHLPTRTGLAFTAYMFSHIQHPDGVKWDEFPFQSTYVMKERKHFLLRSLLGQEQHAMHHFLPHIPWYKYKQVWDLGNGIFTKQAIPQRSVLGQPEFHFKEKLLEQHNNQITTIQVKVQEVLDVAKEIKSFVLVPLKVGTPLPEFTAGSHISIKLPSGKIRSYSLLNAPHERHQYQIAVKKEANGKGGSIEMHNLCPGDKLEVSVPRNNFVLYENVKRYILISGGIGITPLLSMAHRLDELDKHFEFHICAKDLDDIPFQYELKNWSFAPNVEVHIDKDGKSTMELTRVLGNRNEDTLIYSCGPLGFNNWVKSTAADLGWPSAQVKQELFSADTSVTTIPKAFKIVLQKSGKTVEIPANRSIIDMVEMEGVSINYSCLQGTCGTCVTNVTSGEVDHRDAVLSEEEKLRHDKICLCVSRAKGEDIVLDL
ncbi:MAG: fatty acid desaturase, partial [Bacteroidota bacterium]